ncbi:Fungal specific transcription factor [Ascosphaera pollenicola]|nr:Fungal specific transcription factor [Ascosphaera pollenicola]
MSLPFPSTTPNAFSSSRLFSFIPSPIRTYASNLRDSFTQKIRRSGVLDRISHLTGTKLRSFSGGRTTTGGNRALIYGAISWICTVQNVLILLWIFTLYWGERKVWKDSIRSCAWEQWESWLAGATPHHVALVADPQLVDAHTYPGRGWLLSSLTEYYADSYLYRGYTSLQSKLRPDTTFFLGDLFDGGREWATADGSYESPEGRYKPYDEEYWESEYRRFVRLFFDTWKKSTGVSEIDDDDFGTISDTEKRLKARRQQQRQIVASSPGNHDIGFSNGVNTHVRDRFETWFGPVNRVDVIGNHSFVSIDGLSLSAMDPEEREAAGDQDTEHIWKDTRDFLDNVQKLKARAVRDELRGLRGETYYVPDKDTDTGSDTSEFPTIILSHVPFWRDPATPCGPLRERYPDPKRTPDDQRNSILIQRGYQYQNVLTDWVTGHIFDKVGNGIRAIYSGDDHDYCEIEHMKYASEEGSSPKEITVKSTSMAMGVRKPGFLLVSLWNPVDTQTGKSSQGVAHLPTIQNKLCLLPDQLSIFICYGYMAAFTAAVLMIRAIFALRFNRGHLYSLLPSQRSREHGRSISTSNTSPLESVLEDQPLLPLHRQPATAQRLSPRPVSLPASATLSQLAFSPSSNDDRGMKTVSSPMLSSEALPSGKWSASSSSSAGHGRRKGSIGGRGRTRSITLGSSGTSPIRIADTTIVTASKPDFDGTGKPHEETGLNINRTTSSPTPSDISGYPSHTDREAGSHAIDFGTEKLEALNTESRDPFGPSPTSSVNWEHIPRRSAVGRAIDVVKTHILMPLKPVAVVAGVLYLFLLWTW